MRGPIAERLAALSVPEPNTGCVLWTGHVNREGYGRIRSGRGEARAHRVAWELAHGPIPAGLVVRHVVCCTPACVNPAHLAIGTQADNVADRGRDGHDARGERHGSRTHPERLPRGRRNGSCRLTEDDVRAIRAARAGGMFMRHIAKQFGVAFFTVQKIVSGKNWGWLN